MTRPVTLLLPGLHPMHDARPHTFRAWAAQDQRACVVEQHDWARPLRGDWLMQLDTAVLQADGLFEANLVSDEAVVEMFAGSIEFGL